MQKNKNKPKKKKPPFVSKLYWAEPRLPCFYCLLHLFTKFCNVTIPGVRIPPSCSVTRCSSAPASHSHAQPLSNGGTGKRKWKERKKGCKGHIDIFGATSCTLLLLDKRRGRGSRWSRQQQSRSAFWKKEGMQSTQPSNMRANEC